MARPVILATLLGATIGVPYVVSKTGNVPTGKQVDPDNQATSSRFDSTLRSSSPSQLVSSSARPAAEVPIYSLNEVFRMDVSQQWVYTHWRRNSIGLSDPALYGIRVPLVTGTQIGDLAGSLTYYFNGTGRVQRLSFRGRTGNICGIARLVTNRFGLTPQYSQMPNEQVYQLKIGDRIKSQLLTRRESVLQDAALHDSFVVELEIEDPNSDRFLDNPNANPFAGVPGLTIHESQVVHPEPVGVGPMTMVELITTTISPASEDISASANQATDTVVQAEEVADKAAANPDMDIRYRMRWGN